LTTSKIWQKKNVCANIQIIKKGDLDVDSKWYVNCPCLFNKVIIGYQLESGHYS
jgi:hypothetical protein